MDSDVEVIEEQVEMKLTDLIPRSKAIRKKITDEEKKERSRKDSKKCREKKNRKYKELIEFEKTWAPEKKRLEEEMAALRVKNQELCEKLAACYEKILLLNTNQQK